MDLSKLYTNSIFTPNGDTIEVFYNDPAKRNITGIRITTLNNTSAFAQLGAYHVEKLISFLSERKGSQLRDSFSILEEYLQSLGVSNIAEITEEGGIISVKYSETSEKEIQPAIVFVSIPAAVIDIFDVEELVNACGDFMEEIGFEMETKDEPVYGSFFQHFLFKSKKRKTKEEIKDLYKKGKEALESQFINLPAAEVTEKLATAAGALIQAIDKQDEAVLRMGAILIVKVQQNNKSVIVAETVSPEITRVLDNNPSLLKHPQAVYELIIGIKGGHVKKQDWDDEQVVV